MASTGEQLAASPDSTARIEAKFDWAKGALEAAKSAAGNAAESQGLVDPDGWRWRVLADLEELHSVIVRDYTKARDKQRSQAWESRMGPIITGGSAGIGGVVAAIGAGIVKSGGWGWLVIVIGVLFAIAGSVFGANSYVRNRNQKLRYLRLMHGLGDYAYLLLPTAAVAEAFQQLDTFRQLWESAGT
jgi:hypothetical protein